MKKYYQLQLRIIWMYCLLIGISILAAMPMACNKRSEFRVDADLVYINDTDKSINYSGLFQLDSGESHTERIIGVGGENANTQNCCQGGLETFQGAYNQVYLVVDDTACIYFDENQGPTTLSNYSVDILEEDHYRYTYQLSGIDFEETVNCQ